MGAPRQLRKRNDNFSKNVTKVGVVGVELDGWGLGTRCAAHEMCWFGQKKNQTFF